MDKLVSRTRDGRMIDDNEDGRRLSYLASKRFDHPLPLQPGAL